MSEDNAIIEGDDPTPSVGWGSYPLDSVFVRTETRTIREVYGRIKKNRYILNPDFQREFVWSAEKQSRLIESCLMRIPLPVFYVAEAEDGKIIVVDGLQRLTTFFRYLEGEFALQLPQDEDQEIKLSNNSLYGKKYDDLEAKFQERIDDTQLILYILDQKAPVRAKLDIFDRVNNGEPLTRQQMRNALYNGKATLWLKKAAELPSFHSATQNVLDRKKMIDREAVNHFCAFKLLGYEKYDGDMDSHLANVLEKMNDMSDKALDDLLASFDQSMMLNSQLFGRHAFRKSLGANFPNPYQLPFNMSLFETCSVLFSERRWQNFFDKIVIRDKFINLLDNEYFKKAISSSTHKAYNVKRRFEMVYKAFDEVNRND